MVTRSCRPFLVARPLLAWDGWSESWISSCCAAAYRDLIWVLGAKVTGHPPAFISMQLWSPGTSPTANTLPSVKIFTTFFSSPKALCFPNLKSLFGETYCMESLKLLGLVHVSLLTGGFRMCHFRLVQVLSKFTGNPYWLQLESSRFLHESSEVQFGTSTPTQDPITCHLFAFTIWASFSLPCMFSNSALGRHVPWE